MNELSLELLRKISGKKIRWTAPSYHGNKPYGGIAMVNFVEMNDRRPIHSQIIEGDNLDFAFHDKTTSGYLAYSDSDRVVSFEIIED